MINVYTDGACAPTNPGPAGYAVVAVFPDKSVTTFSECFYRSTNNRMELMAAIKAIELFAPAGPVHIYTDSMYVAYPVSSGKLKRKTEEQILKKPNPDLWVIMQNLIRFYPTVKITWIKGHNGHEWNELADRLSYEILDRKTKKKDHGYNKPLQSRLDKKNLHL